MIKKLMLSLLSICLLITLLPFSDVEAIDKEDMEVQNLITEDSTAAEEDVQIVEFNKYDKVELKSDIIDGIWQIDILGNWLSMPSEKDTSFLLTYAKIINVYQQGNPIRLRRISSDQKQISKIFEVKILDQELFSLENKPTLFKTGQLFNSSINDDGQQDSLIHTITINYDRKDRTVIKNTVYLRVPDKTNLDEEYTDENTGNKLFPLEVPDVIGYKPTLRVFGQNGLFNYGNDEIYINDEGLFINMQIVSDFTIIVLYEPKDVNYSVKYWKQAVLNDEYMLDSDIGNYQALTGSFLPDFNEQNPYADGIVREFPGFMPLRYDSPENGVAADGSTILDLYYDRLYYMVSFKLSNGGYGTDSIYERYGAPINVTIPHRPGYEFKGWTQGNRELSEVAYEDDDGELYDANGEKIVICGLESTVPYENSVYTAIWQKTSTKYRTAYYLESLNSTTDNPIYDYVDSIDVYEDYNRNPIQDGYVLTERDIKKDWPNYPDAPTDPDKLYYEKFYSSYVGNDVTYALDKGNNIIVNGDGTTTVRVYYNRDKFTLKFYYAMSQLDGSDTNYYVVGGSTYAFGNTAAQDVDKNDEKALVNQYRPNGPNNTAVGQVNKLPVIDNANQFYKIKDDNDALLFDEINGVKYYYFLLENIMYDENISDKWPTNPFDLNGDNKIVHNNNNNTPQTCYNAGWNGEYNVAYSKHANETIKGKYAELDHRILWEEHQDADASSFAKPLKPSDMTVSYLCFWEGGANVGWSHPALFRYNTYVEYLDEDGFNRGALSSNNINPVGPVNQIVYYNSQTNDLVTNETLNERDIRTALGYKTYYLLRQTDTYDNSTVEQQTIPTLVGLHCINGDARSWSEIDDNVDLQNAYSDLVNSAQGHKAYNIYNLYDRDRYQLTYYDEGKIDRIYSDVADMLEDDKFVSGSSEGRVFDGIPYYKDLSIPANSDDKFVGYNYQPDYPNDKEPGAYHFVGWNKSPNFPQDQLIDFESQYMPARDSALYAQWEINNYDVQFYLNASLKDKIGENIGISHGSTLNLPAEVIEIQNAKKNGNDDPLIGWFYLDKDNNEHIFDIEHMHVKQDMNLYPKYRSTTQARFSVHYMTLDDDGNQTTTKLAPDYTSTFLLDGYKTVRPVGEEDFYPEYIEKGYFPTIASHTINQSDEVEDNGILTGNYEFTFWYKIDSPKPYTVYYIDSSTNTSLLNPLTYDSNRTILVRETAPIIPGYIVDEYQKSLVVTTNEDENKLYFYYSKAKISNAQIVVLKYVQDFKNGKINDDLTSWPQYPFNSLTDQYIIDIPENETVEINRNLTALSNAFRVPHGYSELEDKAEGIGTIASGGNTYVVKLYYQKNKADLTIMTNNASAVDGSPSFLFKVEGNGLPNGGIKIAINGNNFERISDLYVGESYTITQLDSWSWRYDSNLANSKTVTLAIDGTTVQSHNDRQRIKWLAHDSYKRLGGN